MTISMTPPPLPDRKHLTIGFAHASYRLADRFAARDLGIAHFEVRSATDLAARVGQADVLVVSGLWQDELLDGGSKLRFVQSISAGVNQYAQAAFRAKGVRLASAQGVNEVAVAEHAMALMLGLTRQLHTGRDNQTRKHWRPMISEIAKREDELCGKTLVVVGFGRIGARLARLAKAFDMRVVGVRRTGLDAPGARAAGADAVYGRDRLLAALAEADVVALTCPLTPETERMIDAAALAAMKPTAMLINVARGGVVDEAALVAALTEKRIAAAGLDVTREEPLAGPSPLWELENVLLTPHTAGETQRYEDNVIDVLIDNLDRLWRGETKLRNEIV